jgi:hypothetical protein
MDIGWIRSRITVLVFLIVCLCSCGGIRYHLNYNKVEGVARDIAIHVKGQGTQTGARVQAIPGVAPLVEDMKDRYKRLSYFYESGSAVEKDDGYVCMADTRRVLLRDRRILGDMIAQENSAREQVYKAVAEHFKMGSEYTEEVARIFAREWAKGKK